MENTAVGHPQVAEAAAVGMPHPQWGERPLLVVVPAEGTSPTREGLLDYLTDKVAKIWMPDDVIFMEELPHTATGKISKLQLRQKLEGYSLPTA